jgi:hypothetical protein
VHRDAFPLLTSMLRQAITILLSNYLGKIFSEKSN